MSSELQNLVQMLKTNPGYVYVNPEGTYLFALVGPEEKLMVAAAPMRNLHEMSQTELDEFIVKLLRN